MLFYNKDLTIFYKNSTNKGLEIVQLRLSNISKKITNIYKNEKL